MNFARFHLPFFIIFLSSFVFSMFGSIPFWFATNKFCVKKRNSQLDIFGLKIFSQKASKWNWIFSTSNSQKIIKQIRKKQKREEKKTKAQTAKEKKKSSKCGSYCLICWHFSYGFDEVNMIHFCMCIFSLRKSMWILYSISSYFWDFYVNQLLGRKELWTMVVWKWPKTIEWNSHWISVCIKKTTRSSSSKEIELLLSQRLYFGHWFVMMNNSRN